MPQPLIPLTLYIHIPWCLRKCPYCDFNSHVTPGPLPETAYIDALLADLSQDRAWGDGRRIESIFIGGGTPSLFSAEALDRLLNGVRAQLALRPDAEITLEANPGAVEQGRFTEFRAAGINRLSIGVQSFDDTLLQRLGRVHDRRAALAAVEAAHTAGFDNFNLDVMFGLPGQSMAQARRDLAEVLALQPPHLSYYQLTLEPGTRFFHTPPVLPSAAAVDAIQCYAHAALQRAGYQHYEVSAYGLHQQRCRHNLNYWQFGDYLGIGAGAHGKWTDLKYGRIQRYWKPKEPRIYLQTAATKARLSGTTLLTPADLPVEFLMNALRLVAGVPATLFTQRTGLPLQALQPGLDQAREQGLLEPDPDRLQATGRGLRFLNDLLQRFLPEE